MFRRTSVVLAMAVSLGAASGPALADGDAEAGAKVFNKCKACHTIAASDKHKVGPNLHGVIGRAAGTADGYRYSKAMSESGLTWDEATLTQYLHAPRDFVKGTKMSFAGLKKDDEIEDVLAYIKAESAK